MHQLFQHTKTAQLQILEMLRQIELDAAQNPASAYHSFEVQFMAKYMCTLCAWAVILSVGFTDQACGLACSMRALMNRLQS